MVKKQNDLPRTMNQRQAIALLKVHGWTLERGGKHQVKMTKPGRGPVTLPEHRGSTYSVGFTAAILREAGLRTASQGDE